MTVAWVTQLQIDVMTRSIETEEMEVRIEGERIERLRRQLEIAQQAHEDDAMKLAIRKADLKRLIERRENQTR